MLIGENVSLIDMMNRRDARVSEQNSFLIRYHEPVISFCLNIPGPVKTTGALRQLFEDAKYEILTALSNYSCTILDSIEIHEKTGDEFLVCVQKDALTLKKIMSAIEESHPLGRLFDIDIIDINGEKLSRQSYRKCLLCEKQAQECARSRTHSIAEMQEKIENMLTNYYS